MPRIIDAFAQFFDGSGDPLVNGWLKFTLSGTNNTDKDTYADISETIANTNPLQLDAEGRCPNVFGQGAYRVTSFTHDAVLDAPGSQIQQFDPVGNLAGGAPFEDWNSVSIYSIGNIVAGSDSNYYISLINDNQGNDPTLDAVSWMQIELVTYWNANKTYSSGDRVRISGTSGYIFTSLVDNNSNKDPGTNSVEWQADLIRTWDATSEFALNEVVVDSNGVLWRSTVADNLNNNPNDYDAAEWRSVVTEPIYPQTGGATLLVNTINELQDGSTYTLPEADTVQNGDWIICEQPDKYSSFTPTVQVGGTDAMEDSDGDDADGEVLFDAGVSSIVRFISNGVDKWRI